MARAAKPAKSPAASLGATAPGTAREAASGGGSLLWLQGLACGGLAAFAAPVALLMAVLMAPSAIALVVDRTPGKPVARAVALGGAAFTIGPVWRLWAGGGDWGHALSALADPMTLLAAWLAAACGWAMCELLPALLRIALDVRARAELASLAAEAATIKETWDLG